MRKITKIHRLAVCCLMLVMGREAGAQILLDPVAWTSTFGLGATLGYSFTVGPADIVVTQMGYFDRPHLGLANAYAMGIWDNTQALVATATVPAGTNAPLIGDYHYVALTPPVTLKSGKTYTVGGRTTGADSAFQDGTATVNGATVINPALYDNTHPSLAIPTGSGSGHFFQVNLLASVNITGLALTNRLPTIQFAGIAGKTYLIQAKTNLSSPTWITISTNTAGTNGVFQYTDTHASNSPTRYYRTSTP